MIVYRRCLVLICNAAKLKIMCRNNRHATAACELRDNLLRTDDTVCGIGSLEDLIDQSEHWFFLFAVDSHLLDA